MSTLTIPVSANCFAGCRDDYFDGTVLVARKGMQLWPYSDTAAVYSMKKNFPVYCLCITMWDNKNRRHPRYIFLMTQLSCKKLTACRSTKITERSYLWSTCNIYGYWQMFMQLLLYFWRSLEQKCIARRAVIAGCYVQCMRYIVQKLL